ncbi:MAG: S9 family peptidase [Acidimicrobiia bacterium]
MVKPEDPRLHPDGSRIAWTTSQLDLDEDRYRRSIWLWDGSANRQFTSGDCDRAPRWSPGGERLAFLRSEKDEKHSQVAVMPASGGEARVLTELPLGFESLEWSPDGRWLAARGTDWTDEWGDLSDEERKRQPKRITRYPYRFDTIGWLFDRRRHIYLIDPEGVEPLRCLTPGDFDETDFAWRADSGGIAFCGARHPDRGLEPGVSVFELDLDSEEPVEVVERGLWGYPTYSPDGVLHLIGDPDPWGHPTTSAMWRLEDDGALTDLTGHIDRNLHWILPATVPDRPQWTDKEFVALVEDAGRIQARRFSPDGDVSPMIEGDRVVTGVTVSEDGSRMAFVANSPTDPGEVYLWDNGDESRLTDFNQTFRETVDFIEPQPFSFTSDGTEVHAWAYLPAGSEQVPMLLNIHGGPASQYGYGFFDEFQIYASAGYGVVACNPRGSTGRGREFVRAVTDDGWGTADMADVTACVDEALNRFPRLDPDRLGVMGGSYGGFLTAWLTAHDHRYSSAIVERALLSWESFAGTSDIGATFSKYYLSTDLPDGRELLSSKSPLTYAHQITTPTLILHSENDFRCPIEQAEQLFLTLLKAGTEAEMVRFPGEGHELSRSGLPKHRLERFEIVLDWHARHLGGSAQDVGS